MEKGSSYSGSCFCGAVQFTVSGEPVAMGYCHCDSCRHWSAGPVNMFTLGKPDAVQITQGAENIGASSKTPHSYRKWCKSCGGHIFTERPEWGLIDVYAGCHSRVAVQGRRACALSRDRFADQGRGDETQSIFQRKWVVQAPASPNDPTAI